MKRAKKLRFLIFSFLIINSSLLISQPGWIQNYDPFAAPLCETSYQVGNILLTDEGDFIINGQCYQTFEMDELHFGYLMKTDNEGNVIWATIDTVSVDPYLYNGDQATMAILPDGGYVTIGEINFDPSYLLFRGSNGIIINEKLYYENLNYKSMCIGQNNNTLIIAGAANGGLLQKTDLQGNEIWRQIYTEFNIAISVIPTSDGGYAIGIYGNDFGIAKVDSEGFLQWLQFYDYNSQYDRLNSIIQTSDEGYLLCGYTDLPQGSDNGGFLVKTDAVGDTLWTSKYDYNYCSTVNTAIETEFGFTIYGIEYGQSFIAKLNYEGEINNYEIVPDEYYSYSEICFQQTIDNGYICYLRSNDWQVDGFGLIKTDEYGIVPVLNNTITKIDNAILSCFPNPFNPSTTICYNLPDNIEKPIIEIYNIRGQKIRTFNCYPELVEGQSSIIWDGTDQYRKNVSSGIYLYRIKSDRFVSKAKKMLLLK